MMGLSENTVDSIEKELKKAIEKFPNWSTDPLHAAAVVSEEVGELVKSILEYIYEPAKQVTIQDIENEAIQVAAMALRFVASVKMYEFHKSEQHVQKYNSLL